MIVDQPLAGKRIIVTRPRHQAGQLCAELAKLGAEPIEIPTIEIVPPLSFGRLDSALRNLRQYHWLVVTSANTVRIIRERCGALKLTSTEFAHLKIAAVGAVTAHALEEAGLQVAVTPKDYIAESLVGALGDEVKARRVLIVRAAIARDVIPDALRERGSRVDIVEAYRTVIPHESVEKVGQVFVGAPPDAATFSSSSAVTNFFQLLREAGLERPATLWAISIGPITSQTLREHGWEPAAEADPHDVAGLVAATVQALG